jgi:hypothetical protein
MALVYDESVGGGKFNGVPISQWGPDAVMRSWQGHAENRAYLAFLYSNGSIQEKAQAAKELKVAERKLAFWERHPAFDKSSSKAILDVIRAKWAPRAKRG